MRSVLVTGGAGYIGSHTAKALKRRGFNPVTLDNLSAGHKWAVKWGLLAIGDIGDYGLVRQLVRDYRIDAAIHFAAHAYVGESMRAPIKYFQNNVAKTLELLRALIEGGVNKVVVSSTCATYGQPVSIPIGEDHPQSPINPYGESKLFLEKALRWYEGPHNLRSVALRYFNAAGADPEGEIGEEHDPETHLIPLAIQAALDPHQSLKIFGKDYPTPDGTAIRDYVHVTDLADAHVRALEYLNGGGQTTAFNLGTGRGHSVREVVSSVERVSGERIGLVQGPSRPGDPAMLVADAAFAREMLGWRPAHTNLDEIVSTAWHWHSSRVREHAAVG